MSQSGPISEVYYRVFTNWIFFATIMGMAAKINLAIISALLLSSIFTYANGSASCGPKAGVVEKLLTDKEKIRLKCIDDYFNEKKKQTEQAVQELDQQRATLKAELLKLADSSKLNGTVIQCNNAQNNRDVKTVEKCEEVLRQYQFVNSEIDRLMGWSQKIKMPEAQTEENLNPPCPSDEALAKIQKVRYTRPLDILKDKDKSFYKIYERCRILSN